MNQVSTLQIKICFFCKEDLQNQVLVQCEECLDLEVCLFCFLKQKNNETHKDTHNYRVIGKLQRQGDIHQDWTAFEELRFLELLSMKGYGNWEDFSSQIKSKSPSQLEEFFNNILLPKIFKGWKEKIIPFQSQKERINQELQVYIEKAKQLRLDKKFDQTTFFGEHLGHMPLRDEFEYEHENEAEILLSEIHNKQDDTDQDDQLKFNLLELYNRRIKERNKRREFLIDWDKLDFEKTLRQFSEMPMLEREVRYDLMKFEWFLSKEEFKEFSDLMVEQANLQMAMINIETLQKNGIESFEDFQKLAESKGEIHKYDHDLSQIVFQEQKGRRKGNKQWYGVTQQDQKQYDLWEQDQDAVLLQNREIKFCQENQFIFDDFQKIKEAIICYNIRHTKVNKQRFIKEKLPQLSELSQDNPAIDLFNKMFEFFKKESILIED